MAKEVTVGRLRDGVVSFYLERADGCTVDELAAHVGCAVSTIRKRLRESGGLPGVVVAPAVREVPSAGLGIKVAETEVFFPTRSYLRQLLLAARGVEV
jgi:hypothetical protein